MKEKILNLTKQLIIIESESENIEKLNKIITFVENYIKENVKNTDFLVERKEFNSKPSLIIKNFDWKDADIILNWHLDVVNVNDIAQFNPYEEDWKLYWRGAWDMKSWCAIIIELMIELLSLWYKSKKIMLILNSDEEVWGFDWVAKIVEEGYKWDVVLIPDGWSLKKIIYKEKWVFVFWFKIHWKSCHSATPWRWDNAIEKAYKFYKELKTKLENEKVIYSAWNKWWETVVLAKLNAWKWDNMVPDIAEGSINIRFTESYLKKEIEEIIIWLLKKNDWEIIFSWWWEVMYTPEDDSRLQDYLIIAKNKWLEHTKLTIEHWASDWRFFSEKGSVVIIQRPTCKNIHWKEEYVIIDDFEKIYNIYKEFIVNL